MDSDMEFYDELPKEVRAWLQINECVQNCETILRAHREKFEENVDKTLEYCIYYSR